MLKEVCKYHPSWYLKEQTQTPISLWLLELWSEFVLCTLHLRANLYAVTHASSPETARDGCCAASFFLHAVENPVSLNQESVLTTVKQWCCFSGPHTLMKNDYPWMQSAVQKFRVVTFMQYIGMHSQGFCCVPLYKTLHQHQVVHTV